MARLCARALEAGIEVGYVQGLVRSRGLVLEPPPVEVEAWPWPLRVYTLGRFALERDGRPVAFARKIQRRPLLLLKALLAFGGRAVPEARLTEALWPDAEGDAARQALATTVFRLRKLLGEARTLLRQEDQLTLDDRVCWVDVWALERYLDHAEAAAKRGTQDDHAWEEAVAWTEKASQAYRGPFLADEPDLPWASGLADRLRRRLRRQLTLVGGYWEELAQFERAAEWYERALGVDPCAEDCARRLMAAYRTLGRREEALHVYGRLREGLSTTHGVLPSQVTEALYASLRSS
jgi:DNA-binding SARP family transcriptional activator